MPVFNTTSDDLPIKGPLVDIYITIPIHLALLNKEKGMPLPAFKGRALIDTGAGISGIGQSVIKILSLLPRDEVELETPLGKGMQLLYDVGFQIPLMGSDIRFLQVVHADIERQGIQALIGRDLLKNFTLFYNGITNSFSLHY